MRNGEHGSICHPSSHTIGGVESETYVLANVNMMSTLVRAAGILMAGHQRAAVPCINHRFSRQFWGRGFAHEGGVDTNADITQSVESRIA